MEVYNNYNFKHIGVKSYLSETVKSYLTFTIDLMEENITDYKTMKNAFERDIIIGTAKFKESIMGIEEDTPLSLDEILKTACPEEKEFQLIKEGSRKRYLTRYKKK